MHIWAYSQILAKCFLGNCHFGYITKSPNPPHLKKKKTLIFLEENIFQSHVIKQPFFSLKYGNFCGIFCPKKTLKARFRSKLLAYCQNIVVGITPLKKKKKIKLFPQPLLSLSPPPKTCSQIWLILLVDESQFSYLLTYYLPTYLTKLEKFRNKKNLLSFMTYSQNWLSPLVDDRQSTYLVPNSQNLKCFG